LILRLLKTAAKTSDLDPEQARTVANFIDARLASIRFSAKAGWAVRNSAIWPPLLALRWANVERLLC
jgi:hypothetical protein